MHQIKILLMNQDFKFLIKTHHQDESEQNEHRMTEQIRYRQGILQEEGVQHF